MPYTSVTRPAGNYAQGTEQAFSYGQFYSGLFANTGSEPVTLTFQLGTGENFQPVTIPAASILSLQGIPLVVMGYSAFTGYYSFIGTTAVPSGSPSVSIIPLTIAEIVGAVSIKNTPGILQFDYPVTSTASSISSDVVYRDEITVLADPNNTATVLVGSAATTLFPLAPGAAVTLRKLTANLIYASCATASQLLHVISGGSE